MNEHTFLVAITVESDSREAGQELLQRALPRPHAVFGRQGTVTEWWIAEDDAIDGNDNDSAIFVPRGAQGDMRDVIQAHFDAHEDEWVEEGYPYADTDVSGTWFPPGIVETAICRHCQRFIVRQDGRPWIDPEAKGDDRIWRETCESHDTVTAEHEPEGTTS